MYSSSAIQQPDYPAAISSLQHLDSDSLKEILNNEEKFDEFIADLPQMKNLYAEKEMLLVNNKSLAEYNLSQEPVVREAKQKLLDRFQEATKLADEVKKLKSELDSKSGKMNPDSLLILLEAASQEAEEESEVMVDMFMSNGGSLEEFLDQYKEKRKLAHLRRIKIDKMKELLAAKTSSSGAGQGSVVSPLPARPAPPPPGIPQNFTNPYPPRSPYTGVGVGLPYPAQPTNGPMGYPVPVPHLNNNAGNPPPNWYR